MSFEDNPADDRYELDQCIEEIKRLKEENGTNHLDSPREKFPEKSRISFQGC